MRLIRWGLAPNQRPWNIQDGDRVGVPHCRGGSLTSRLLTPYPPESAMARTCALLVVVAVGTLTSTAARAHSSGITGYSGNPEPSAGGGANCASCHSGGGYSYAVGTIEGSTEVDPSTWNAYTLNFTTGGTTAASAGFNLSATGGTLAPSDSSVRSGTELTHSAPRVPSSGSFSWSFNWTAPAVAGTYKFYFCNLPVNGNRSITNDGAVRCGNVDITVKPPPPDAIFRDGFEHVPDTIFRSG